jgi:hypothetical protein
MDVEKVTHPTEMVKRLSTNNIKLDIFSNGSGEIDFDGEGQRFNGTDDQFLLGLVHINRNRSNFRKDFEKALHKTEPRITKIDIKKAIIHSLNQNKTDGLYAVLGDNSRYNDGDDEIDSEVSNESYEIEGCLKRNFLEETIARDVADCITEKAGENLPSASQVFEKYENDLADEFYPYKRGVSWKQFIFDTMETCDRKHNLEISPFFRHQNDAVGFIGCILDEIEDYRDGVDEGFFETMQEEFRNKWDINPKFLKEISEERSVPFELLEHCTHGGYETLEKFRPIPIPQQFLETFGAEIKEFQEKEE